MGNQRYMRLWEKKHHKPKAEAETETAKKIEPKAKAVKPYRKPKK